MQSYGNKQYSIRIFMTNEHAVAAKVSPATWMGLFLSLFAMVVIRQAFAVFVPDIRFASAIVKETLIWASAAALVGIILRGERLPMRSIGLGTARWWVSILWGFVIAVVSAAVSADWLISLGTATVRAPLRSRNCRSG